MIQFKQQVEESLKQIKSIIAEAKTFFSKVTPIKVVFMGPNKEQIELFQEAHIFSVPREGNFVRVSNNEFSMRGIVQHVEWSYELDLKKRISRTGATVMIFLAGVTVTPFEQRTSDEQKN